MWLKNQRGRIISEAYPWNIKNHWASSGKAGKVGVPALEETAQQTASKEAAV